MCAINGFTFEDPSLLAAMNTVTAHRGPDGTGAYCKGGVSLGHNRLSIIDLSAAGAQPMHSDDGAFTLVFNGEIYNFQELRAQLAGYPFKSKTDTEVILAAYARWGKDSFRRFNGMFAFALWDSRAQELLLVRDRAGIKPLYYSVEGGTLIFSSEIKGLLEHPTIKRVIDHEALAHYLRVGYVPAPLTMLKGICKLEAGHVLTYRKNGIEVLPFDLEASPLHKEPTDEELRNTVQEAVVRQLVSDRPVGIYLSGGLDSSIVLSSAARVHGAIDTFSINFALSADHARQETFSADAVLARETAARYGARHHEVSFSGDDAAALFDKMIWHLDEPVGNPTCLPMLRLGAFAKERVAVVLGGDGGDELFGGYERYRLSLLSSYYQRLPAALRSILGRLHSSLRRLNVPPGAERFASFMFQKDGEVARVLKTPLDVDSKQFFKERFFTPVMQDFETQFMNTDRASWLIDECLSRTDKMSMASGLEVRVPLLDDKVAALAVGLPRHRKVTLRETKRALRDAFRGQLPAYLFNQPKRGWFAPGGEWIKGGAFGALADEVLSVSYYPGSADLFDWAEVRIMLERHRTGEEYHMVMLWMLLVLQAWMKKFNVAAA